MSSSRTALGEDFLHSCHRGVSRVRVSMFHWFWQFSLFLHVSTTQNGSGTKDFQMEDIAWYCKGHPNVEGLILSWFWHFCYFWILQYLLFGNASGRTPQNASSIWKNLNIFFNRGTQYNFLAFIRKFIHCVVFVRTVAGALWFQIGHPQNDLVLRCFDAQQTMCKSFCGLNGGASKRLSLSLSLSFCRLPARVALRSSPSGPILWMMLDVNIWRVIFGVNMFFSVFGIFFDVCFCFLLFCFSQFFSAFIILCFSASPRFCFFASSLLCFSTVLPLCFSAFLLFPAFLPFQLLSAFPCFSAFPASLLTCFSASLRFPLFFLPHTADNP